MSVSFDPLLVLQLLGVFAGVLNMLLSKAPRKILNCFLVFGGLKNKTLTSHFYFHSSKKYGLTFFLSANSLFRPSIHKWDWLSLAHPYGSISNSSCTGYQILCLLVPGSKSSADLWTSVKKKKKKNPVPFHYIGSWAYFPHQNLKKKSHYLYFSHQNTEKLNLYFNF